MIALIDDLKAEFAAVYNENVEMLSIRHYTTEAVERITTGREILTGTENQKYCEICCKKKKNSHQGAKAQSYTRILFVVLGEP